MAVFEFGEVFNLVFDVVIFLFLLTYYAVGRRPRRYFLFPVAFLLLSHLFTVIEGITYPVFFNLLEHFFFLLSVLMLAGCLMKLFRESE